MKAIKSRQAIIKQLESKEKRLHKILDTPEPIIDTLYEAHLRRQINSVNFLDELDEVKLVLSFGNIQLVTLPEFEHQLGIADSSTVSFNGEFCKLAMLQNYPNKDCTWILYVAPVESI